MFITSYRAIRGKMLDKVFMPDKKGELSYVVPGFSSTSISERVIESFRNPNDFNVKVKILQKK